jgi:hypothetical protein
VKYMLVVLFLMVIGTGPILYKSLATSISRKSGIPLSFLLMVGAMGLIVFLIYIYTVLT